ncbi:hypothetical protein COW86_04070, partial [Candidatus Kuenenbacteria bacterium CG22_combo_CG10-13_8_21_14_all_39_9]
MPKKEQFIQSEVREDKIHDRFVIMAPGRSKRPKDVGEEEKFSKKQIEAEKKACVFCPGNQKKVPGLYFAGDKNNWQVKVVKNIFPAVTPENKKVYGYQ